MLADEAADADLRGRGDRAARIEAARPIGRAARRTWSRIPAKTRLTIERDRTQHDRPR